MPSTSPPSKAIAVALLVALLGAGIWGTWIFGFRSGMFAAIDACRPPIPGEKEQQQTICPNFLQPMSSTRPLLLQSLPGSLSRFAESWLHPLVAFFAIALDAPPPLATESPAATATGTVVAPSATGTGTFAVLWFLMAQFGAGWCLVALEGRHRFSKPSAGRGSSSSWRAWTGLMGWAFQNATIAVVQPLWMIAHVITFPSSAAGAVVVDAEDFLVLGPTNILSFWVPSVMMALPVASSGGGAGGSGGPSSWWPVPSVVAHYAWIAFWQPFPFYHSACRWALTAVLRRLPARTRNAIIGSGSPGKRSLAAAKYAYAYVLLLAVTSQMTLLAVALSPVSASPCAWSRQLFAELDFRSAFVPRWPWETLSFDAVTGAGMAELSKLFFQWDLLAGNHALLVWAAFVYRCTARARAGADASMMSLVRTIVPWYALGGPAAAAAILLWERDKMVLPASEVDKRK